MKTLYSVNNNLNNLELVPLSQEFVSELYLNWLNDPEITEFLEIRFNKYSNLEQLVKYVENINWIDIYVFAIVDKKTNRHIGNISINNIKHRHKTFDMGNFIGDRRYWGGNYNFSVLGMAFYYAFEIMNLRKFFGGAYVNNIKAIFTSKKIGCTVEGYRAESHFYKGEYTDSVCFSMNENQWHQSKIKHGLKFSKQKQEVKL